MTKFTIHLVCNAHLDPVWLWRWTAGLDEIINTCSSVCDLLDRNPDVVFTRGESWVYQQLERIAPRLFARIRRHIEGGRWETVGGWYIQPDCNLPHVEGFRKQIELGRDYFRRTFGDFPRVAYNVDSFGHAAILPQLMWEAGQRYYVMMRPQEHELALPSRLFRWRGQSGGPEVLAFRIAGAYHSSDGLTLGHLEKSLTGLPVGIRHTMCFVGVGDHGGGPTQAMIDWCRDHADAIPGARLKFSSPARFFRAVARQARLAPLVSGELQHHAIGCFSVHRAVKTAIRRAEHALLQAGEAMKQDPRMKRDHSASIARAWEWVCFNHFHDTLGGTCLPSAYAASDAQLGFAWTAADEVTALALRRRMVKLKPSPHQRLVVGNYSGADFSGWVEHEPWLEWTRWKPDWGLIDETGRPIAHQLLATEALFGESPRLLFKLAVESGGCRVLRIVSNTQGGQAEGPCGFFLVGRDRNHLEIDLPGRSWKVPALQVLADRSDTWSHGLDRFRGPVVAKVKWGKPRRVDQGPLMTAWCADGRIGRSRIAAEFRLYAGEPFIEMRLRIEWRETRRLLRLCWRQPAAIVRRTDGVSGGFLEREGDGRERPVHDWTMLERAGGGQAGVVFPDVFSMNGTRRELRLTLLRSPAMAHHEPASSRRERRVISDQGIQVFLFRFFPDLAGGRKTLENHALGLHRPPLVADLTHGMPARAGRGRMEIVPDGVARM